MENSKNVQFGNIKKILNLENSKNYQFGKFKKILLLNVVIIVCRAKFYYLKKKTVRKFNAEFRSSNAEKKVIN